MNAATLIALAEAAARIYGIVMDNIEKGKATMGVDDLATVRAILDPLHARNMALSAELDALAAEAEKRV